jgi:hypothetical protein
MKRRDLLRSFAASSALALLPHEAVAAWARVATGMLPTDSLNAHQLALIGAVADTIIPRTDSPGATDVGVPAFINVIVSENYTDADRIAFITGIDSLGAFLKSSSGIAFTDLSTDARGPRIEAIEAQSDHRSEPSRTYWRLKGLVIHGYFTSEPVMKNVLHYEIMPGRFDGSAPMPAKAAHRADGHSHA